MFFGKSVEKMKLKNAFFENLGIIVNQEKIQERTFEKVLIALYWRGERGRACSAPS